MIQEHHSLLDGLAHGCQLREIHRYAADLAQRTLYAMGFTDENQARTALLAEKLDMAFGLIAADLLAGATVSLSGIGMLRIASRSGEPALLALADEQLIAAEGGS